MQNKWTNLDPPPAPDSTPVTPPPRYTHAAVWVQQASAETGRLLVYGGQGQGGKQMDDMWALRGVGGPSVSSRNVQWSRIAMPSAGDGIVGVCSVAEAHRSRGAHSGYSCGTCWSINRQRCGFGLPNDSLPLQTSRWTGFNSQKALRDKSLDAFAMA